jgi:ADP-heptose:LPS heptosyltransferase
VPRNVLILKTAAIGDCLNALPAVRSLRRALPQARLTWLIGRAAADAVLGQAPVDDWIVVDDATLLRRRRLPGLLALAVGLRRRRFDAALILHRARPVRLLAAAAGARRRVGLVRSPGDRALLTETAVDEPGVHEAERYHRAAERLAGRRLDLDATRWMPPAEAAGRAAALLAGWGWTGAERVVAMAPGGGVNPRTRFDLKRWPVEKFAETASRLAAHPGRRVLVLGLPDELEAFRAALGRRAGVETAAGDLRLAGALLSCSAACVANDGGLMHLAAAAGVPTVAVFGPTDPAVWGPRGSGHLVVRHRVPCQPCYKDDGVLPVCRWDHRCMRDLSVDEVVEAVGRLLGNDEPGAR